jgi:hypothetical protein
MPHHNLPRLPSANPLERNRTIAAGSEDDGLTEAFNARPFHPEFKRIVFWTLLLLQTPRPGVSSNDRRPQLHNFSICLQGKDGVKACQAHIIEEMQGISGDLTKGVAQTPESARFLVRRECSGSFQELVPFGSVLDRTAPS